MLTAILRLGKCLNLNMYKHNALLTTLCILSMLVLLALQGYWINKYYNVSKQDFEKEVNLAFEDGIKKEFSNRADSIEKILENAFLDSTKFLLTSKYSPKEDKVIYSITSKKDTLDKFSSSVSFPDLSIDLNYNNQELLKVVARRIANNLRRQDLDNHIVYYRTQELGNFMVKISDSLEFDTANLRPVLNKYLAERKIFVPYSFYTRTNDSTTNKSSFEPALLEKYPIITRSIPTYERKKGQNYVRVMFNDPFPYILSNMWLILCSSVLLVVLMTGCLYLLLRSLNKAKKLSMIKNDFISNITHEFKTPISTAMLAVDALSDPTTILKEESKLKYLGHAKNELQKISALTDKILKLSLYDSDRYFLKKEKIEIDATINEIISIYETHSEPIDIQFNNNSEVEHLWVDKTQFQHAIANIIENGVKYGNSPVAITINLYLNNNYLVISIKDNGPGIAEIDLPYVFDKFYRAKMSDKNIKGYGLGLNYVKQIMDQHDGWYSIESNSAGTELKLGWPYEA